MIRIFIFLCAFGVSALATDYKKLFGQSNEFKEGDVAVGVAAKNNQERLLARQKLSQIKLSFLHEHPIYQDEQQALIWQDTDLKAYEQIKNWTLSDLKKFLLSQPEDSIQKIMPGLDSDMIACVVKL